MDGVLIKTPLPAGRHSHVWRETGGRAIQRDGRAVGVQHSPTHLVATPTGPAPAARPGGPLGPPGGAGQRRAGHAGVLRVLTYLQLHQQGPGVQPA